MDSYKSISNDPNYTQYAPPQRLEQSDIYRQRKLLTEHYSHIRDCFEAVSEIILIVNENRQIVFFNQHAPQVLKSGPESIFGKRPGEALDCMYGRKNPAGCGTSKFCSECGAVNAILSSLNDKKDVKECRIQQTGGNAFDLLIKTTPLNVCGEKFSIVAITDISHEKRRRMLERLFFHDIMNTAASIHMISGVLKDCTKSADILEFRQTILLASSQLIDELKSQKEFLAAEANELKTKFKTVLALQLLDTLIAQYKDKFTESGLVFKFMPAEKDISLSTDPALLGRVISNMLKNAIEASEQGQTVTLSFRAADGFVEFSVHNQTCMPENVQLQLFQRSFSTKGIGRGLGTYSMKLLSERYLNGKVDFVSSPEHGTTFFARYPAL